MTPSLNLNTPHTPIHQDVLASSNACAEEAFMSARVVRATGTEAIEQQRYLGWLE